MFRKFCLALLCVMFYVPAVASASSVVDRSEFTTTREVAPGELRTTVSPQPLNFQTSSGEWKPVDLALEPAGDGGVRASGVDGEVVIPDALSAPIEVEHDGREVSIRLKGASSEADVDDATAVFDDALPGVDVQYEATARGVKERLVLASSSAPVAFAYDVRGGASWSAVVDEFGAVVLRDGGGAQRYRITAPLAWDSAEDPSFTNDLKLSVSKVSDGRWTVTLRPDLAWLRDSARVFPVTLDPDFSWSNGTTTFNGATDTYLASGDQASDVFSASSYMQTGHYNRTYKSLLRFDVAAAIPSNAVVSGATFKAYAPPASPKALASHSLRTVTAEWDANANWNRRKVGVSWTTLGGDVSSNPAYTSASTNVKVNPSWYSWTAPLATVQGWVAGTLPNYGFQLTTDSGAPSGNAYVWASTQASTSSSFPADSTKRPVLEVAWSVPDTTAPALSLSGALSTGQSAWRTAATGDITLAATDAGTGVKRLEILEGSTVIQSQSQSCPAGGCAQNHTFTLDLDALGEGVHTLKAAAVDGGNLRTEQTFTVRVDRATPGLALTGSLVDDEAQPAQSGTRNVHVAATDAGAGIVDLELKVDGVQREHVTQTCANGGCSRTEDWQVDVGALGDGNHTVDITATDGAGRTKTQQLQIAKEAYPLPDAPPLSETSVTPFPQQVDFLYDGPEAVQSGLDEEILDDRRVAVVTGKVFNGEGVPAAGVTISVPEHPEFGETVSRENGQFWLVVNGGAQLRLRYEVQGALSSEREVETKWNDYTWAEDVWLVSADPAGTPVDFGAGVAEAQVASASTITDQDGTRTARVFIRPGTKAWKQKTDGTMEALTGGTLRVTEYTAGEGGPNRMPASLPDVTAYTWAAEFQIDQASGPDVEHVRFDKPVITYLENFTHAPVGMDIPVGTYEPSQGHWVGDPDGRVMKVIGEDNGKAVVDATGFGALNAEERAFYGITDEELETIAGFYDVGDTFWRTELASFSTKDMNKARLVKRRKARPNDPTSPNPDNPCAKSGSIIGCQDQTLGEVADLGGTPYSLRYASDRTPGALGGRAIRVPLTYDTVDEDLDGVVAEVLIAGQRMRHRVNDPQPNQSHTFYWDGEDGFGRKMVGGAMADVQVEDLFKEDYAVVMGLAMPSKPDDYYWVLAPFFDGGQTISWGLSAASTSMLGRVTAPSATQPTSRPSLTCSPDGLQCWYPVDTTSDSRPLPQARESVSRITSTVVPVPYTDARSNGVGGWGVSVQHRYDTGTGTLYTGDGQRRSVSALPDIVETVHGSTDTGSDRPQGVDIAVMPDGSIIRADQWRRRIMRDWPDGHTTVFAGKIGAPFNSGNNGPATEAGFNVPTSVAVGPDGTVYITDGGENVVRAVGTDGIIRHVAGNGDAVPSGDPRDPQQTAVFQPDDVVVAKDGTVYIASRNGLHRMDPGGGITIIAGPSYSGCGNPNSECPTAIGLPHALAIAPDGTLYFEADYQNTGAPVRYLYEWKPGEEQPLMIMSSNASAEELREGPIADSNLVPRDLEVDAKGQLWILDTTHGEATVWRMSADRRVSQIGPDRCHSIDPTTLRFDGEGGPFRKACGETWAITRGPDGMYLLDRRDGPAHIRRVRPALKRYPAGELLVPSEDGSEAYRFDGEGRHLATIDGRTERLIRSFTYDSKGRLAAIAETDFGTTTFTYDAAGSATVTGPDGQTTSAQVNADGYLTKLTDAAGADQKYEYTGDGLMTRYGNQLDKASTFTWSPVGRLITDTSPRAGVQTLARNEEQTATTITHSSPTGEPTAYKRIQGDAGTGETNTITTPNGAVTSSKTDGTGTQSTTTTADGTKIDQTINGEPRWGTGVSTVQTTTTLPSGQTSSGGTATEVQRSTGQDHRDPFDFETIIDTSTFNGRSTTSTYDKDDQTDTVTSPMGRTATVEYDEDDRPVRVSSAGRDDVEVDYDARGRVTAVTQGDAVDTVTYGADGRVATSTDAEGGVTSIARDEVGQPTAVTGPDNGTTGLAYDDAGQLTELTAPDGRQFTFTYDDNGNTTAVVEPARAGSALPALESEVEYDVADRPTRATSPSGDDIDITYDSAGRVASMEAGDGSAVESEFEPSGARNLAAVETQSGVRSMFGYDGPLLTSVTTQGEGDNATEQSKVELAYDNSGRPALEKIGTDTQSFAYNNDDQPTQIGPLQVTYDPQAADTSSIEAGDTITRFDTDTTGLVSGLTASVRTSGVETPVFGEQVLRDKLGRITQRSTTVNGGPVNVNAYTYDDAGHLTEVKTNGLTTEAYGYDNTGGLTSRGNGVLSSWIATDGYGRPTSASNGTSTSWNTDGELTSLTLPGQTASTLTYDGFGRIKTITPQGSAAAAGSYEYDGLGRRVTLRVGGQIQRRYLYGGGEFPRARLDADGDVLERYIYGTQSHVPELIVRRDGQRLRLITDLTGSVRVVIDADTRAVVQQLSYDAYGRTTTDTNPGLQPYGFKGALSDPVAQGAGLLWMGSRAYQPSLARFATPEPLGVAVAWNQHDALAGDPVNLQDADGWFPENQAAADTSAAVGDALLGVFCLGFCNPGAALRDLTGVDDRVTTCSTAYQAGAIVAGFAVPSPGGKFKAAGQGLKAADRIRDAARSPVGRRGNPINADGANPRRIINGREFSGHAQDRMQGRGIPISVVEDALAHGTKSPGRDGATIYRSGTNRVSVVVNDGGRVVTVVG